MRTLHAGDLTVLHASGIRPNHRADLASSVSSVRDCKDMTLPLNDSSLHFSTATSPSVAVQQISKASISSRGKRVVTVTRTAQLPKAPSWFISGLDGVVRDFSKWLHGTARAPILPREYGKSPKDLPMCLTRFGVKSHVPLRSYDSERPLQHTCSIGTYFKPRKIA